MSETIRFSLELMPHLNYAGYVNAIKLIRRLNIENHGEEDITDAVLSISFLPEVAEAVIIPIPRLPARKSVDVGAVDGRIDAQFILSLTGNTPVVMTLRLEAPQRTAEETFQLEAAPYDQWSGYEETPELLAAYSIPAHPVIRNLLTRSGELLAALTGDGSLTGYETQDPNGVLRQISAHYSAVAERGIRSIAAPPDQLRTGRRIRLADEVLEKGYGDSLDLALLFAGLTEAAGLNPLIILKEDRCLAGVWLNREVYPETVNYDSTSITKRMARGVNRICVFDPLRVTQAEGDFNRAMASGLQYMEDPSDFILSLDLKRARLVGIRPLPVRVIDGAGYVLAREQDNTPLTAVLPEELTFAGGGDQTEGEKQPRQKVWERKLLDLSLRNALINYRPERSGIPLAVHDLDRLIKDLLNEAQFNIMHQPSDWTGAVDPGAVPDPADLKKLAAQEYDSGRIRALLDAETLDERGAKLVKGARSSLEETGANSLYLGIGLLTWYTRQDPDTPRQAPLILIPVDCEGKGHLSGLLLKAREEEGHFNVTLTEMLKNDFGISLQGLDPLPVKDGGIDVLAIFSRVRNAILQEKKWDLKETVSLGLFSFSKFILWRDLKDNLTEFSKNKLVGSLMEGKLSGGFEPIELAEDFIDDVPGSEQIIYPVSSDASQSLAVLASAQGRSFVLHGPPGTGKSQTITNIIANALMQDKRVLFVAQKMAALEVVERRLNNIGIGAFCLELHSNKARKKAVLDQLEQSMKIQRIPKNTDYEAEKEAIRARKAKVNEIVRRLHHVDGSGFSIYQLITEHSRVKDFPKYLDLDGGFSTGDLKAKEQALEHLSAMGAHAGGPYGHALRGIDRIEYRPLLKEEIAKAGQLELDPLASALDQILTPDHPLMPATWDQARELAAKGRAVLDLGTLAPALLDADLAVHCTNLSQLIDQTRAEIRAREAILAVFSTEFLDADPIRLERDYNLFEQKNAIGKLFRKNPVEKELVLYSKTGLIRKEEIPNHLRALREYQSQLLHLRKAQSQIQDLLPEGTGNDPEAMGRILDLAAAVKEAITDPAQLALYADLAGEPAFGERLRDYEVLLSSIQAELDRFLTLTAFDEGELDSYAGNYFQRLAAKLAELIPGLDGLRDWIMYRQAAREADELGLKPFTRYYHDGHVSDRELIPAFKKSVIRHELTNRLAAEPVLLNTTGHGLDEQAAQLKERLAEMERLERKELYFHLAGKIPNLVLEKATSREIAVLQRALRSGARNLSIRNLFSETDNLLRRITPCMLMSPMSVAQYLKPQADLFDLVIFDEASQIPTPEAIGSLGRGREAIIVGDPKQLPPTSFFMTQSNGTDEPEEFQDLDNILEDALALSMPESYLLWHYRSRHESLISFSNRNFYDGKLFTYPSPDDMVSKVSLRRNHGVYERGTGRVNRQEAAEVVDEVIRRIQDPALSGQSIGIVTFSVVQQNLIEELLREKVRASEEVERALNAMPEPLFIKNLENVQGDERDVIFFSIGYGPDEEGRMTMNFGPLNQEGGWRRLNVAVSRSRLEMVVFTNIDPTRFNVSASTARGVRDLKAFLEFAQRGTRTLTLEEIREENAAVNLSGQIAERLRERGWAVETSIGTSRFKVDLGIVDPKDPDRFLLGIMCGGESVRSARAAYDREVLQKTILKGLGWQVHRVFAMDWLEHEEGVIDDLIRRAEDSLLSQSQPDGTAADPRTKKDEAGADQGSGQEAVEGILSRQIPYGMHTVPPRRLMLDEFLKVANANVIGQELKAIIEAEGPIARTLLAKRARRLYDLNRVTPKMEQHLERILNKVRPVMTPSADVPVYWPDGTDPQTFDAFRRTLPGDTDRELADIAPEEILSAMRDVLTEPMAERQLIRKTAQILGHPQLNIEKEGLLKSILNIAVLNGQILRGSNGRLTVPAPQQ